MIIVRLFGGMGNQMFQYALGRVLAIKNNTELFLDTIHLTDHGKRFYYPKHVNRNYDLDLFSIQAKIATQPDIPWKYRVWGDTFLKDIIYVLTRKLFKNPYKEKYFHFDPSILTAPDGSYVEGFWQSYKYFEQYSDIIRKDFQVAVSLSQEIKNLGDEIRKGESLCIHVRRGDFVNNAYHEVVNPEYYKKAFQEISQRAFIEKVYVFSDNIAWCKENIQFPVGMVYVDDSFSGERGIGHFWLMTQCNHFIIPNSTFSWWAAWLSERGGKQVVGPKKWFSSDSINYNDIIPPEWIKI